MSAKHTPGPWEFAELRSGDDGLGYIRPVDWDGAEIAHHGDTARSQETNRANARLIAAAPALLEALRETLRHLPPFVRTEVRAAIAKAEGGDL